MDRCNFVYLVIWLFIFSIERGGHVDCTRLRHIRGIAPSKRSLYNPERDFECLDGSKLIRFDRVNDDYCDCGDGSDEPGTAACPNGSFFCENVDHAQKYIPSGFVNDGVCDCCDGSDEWDSDKHCDNICSELGKEARKAAEEAAELAKQGNEIRIGLAASGKQYKIDIQARLVKLETDYQEETLMKKEKEIAKNLAEEKENAALDKYKSEETEQPVDQEQPGDTAKVPVTDAEYYFKMLDSDESGTVTVAELKTRVTFDKDRNGEVTEEEALFFLNAKPEVNLEEFLDVVWVIMKPFVMKEQGIFEPPRTETEKEVQEDHDESSDSQTVEDIETEAEDVPREEEEEEDEEEDDQQRQDTHEKQPEVRYDKETQALIDEATQARERYEEAEKSCVKLQNEIRKIKEKLQRDYGPEEVFASLDGQCYKLTDSEYSYSLCLFGTASQRSLSGGSEVYLGHFHDWAGMEPNKYTKMKYDHGSACWNGPARSTLVNLRCGTENRLTSVSEPSRCEYMMEFTTPALCISEPDRRDSRDEL